MLVTQSDIDGPWSRFRLGHSLNDGYARFYFGSLETPAFPYIQASLDEHVTSNPSLSFLLISSEFSNDYLTHIDSSILGPCNEPSALFAASTEAICCKSIFWNFQLILTP